MMRLLVRPLPPNSRRPRKNSQKNLSPLSPRILSYPHIPHFGGVLEASLTWGMSVPGGAASREPMPPGGAWWSRPSSPAMLRRIVGVKGVRATLKPQPSGFKPASVCRKAKFGITAGLRFRLADRVVPQGRGGNAAPQELNWVLSGIIFSLSDLVPGSILSEPRHAVQM